MAEAKAHGDFRDGGVVQALEQFFPGRRQAEPLPILVRGHGHECAKMLAQRSFSHAAVSDEVGNRNLPAAARSDELDRLLEFARNWPAGRPRFKIEVV